MSGLKTKRDWSGTILGGLGLITAIIALLFSWDANRIAREANSINAKLVNPLISILDFQNVLSFLVTRPETATKPGSHIYCIYKVEMTNSGGASTAIVSKVASVMFNGKGFSVSGDTIAYSNRAEDTLNDYFSSFDVLTTKDSSPYWESTSENAKQQQAEFPYQLDSFKTAVFYEQVSFVFKPNPTIEAGDFYTTDDLSYGGSQLTKAHHELQIEIVYTLSNGERVSTPPETCGYLKLP